MNLHVFKPRVSPQIASIYIFLLCLSSPVKERRNGIRAIWQYQWLPGSTVSLTNDVAEQQHLHHDITDEFGMDGQERQAQKIACRIEQGPVSINCFTKARTVTSNKQKNLTSDMWLWKGMLRSSQGWRCNRLALIPCSCEHRTCYM